MQKIKAHQARIHKLREFDDDRFLTCSDDCTIKFFLKIKIKMNTEKTILLKMIFILLIF